MYYPDIRETAFHKERAWSSSTGRKAVLLRLRRQRKGSNLKRKDEVALMNNNVKKRIEWLVGELLLNATHSVMIHVVYNNDESNAKIYLNGEKVATISETGEMFNFPISNEQIARLNRVSADMLDEIERRGDINE